MPADAFKVHQGTDLKVFGARDGAYIVRNGQCCVIKISNIEGNVIRASAGNSRNGKRPQILLEEITFDAEQGFRYKYYVSLVRQMSANTVTGLPFDAKLMNKHNGVWYFGSGDGAYQLEQFQSQAQKVARSLHGSVVDIQLIGRNAKELHFIGKPVCSQGIYNNSYYV